ncbi:hypothetical protein VPNG_07482 [Cytospora leucostoma]|uniref:Uncharacterized protein n=1 Tax=Cytospora leucostoma TaxID=1230097 RepID=A0A423WS33_9PEZI|nr:hypothetical protein VPNG_07482 [Cytospora leucostoma]
MADDTMDFDEAPELDGDEFVIATADQSLIDNSPGHYPLRNGRAIVKPAARNEYQKPRLHKKLSLAENGVQKKKRSRRHATTVSERKRLRQIRDAMTDGSYLIKADLHSDDHSAMVQDDEHLQRITEEIVLQAVTEHTPGLTFPVSHNSQGPYNPFNNFDELKDLTQALEHYQIALARQGKAILTADAGILVKKFVQDVLRMYKRIRDELGNTLDCNVISTWITLAQSHQDKWCLKWMRGIVGKRLKEKHGKGAKQEFREAFNEAMETAGRHPELDEEIAYAKQLRRPHYCDAMTLRSLVLHFTHARARYLGDINSTGVAAPYNHGGTHLASCNGRLTPFKAHGDVQRQLDVDSSDEEYNGLVDSSSEGDLEDNAQVEGESLVGSDRTLVKALDRWMELSGREKKQDNADMDMLSALNLE